MKNSQPKTIYLRDYKVPAYLIDEVELTFDLNQAQTRVEARLAVRRHPQAGVGDHDLVLDGEQLNLQSVKLGGRELTASEYRLDESSLTIPAVPERFILETSVQIDPDNNTALEGLYRSSGMYCTQCEAEGFRRITYFIDRPDVMARYTTRIIAAKADCPVLLSNGNPVESGELEDGRHWVTWEDPFPKPSYLFALVAGDLQYIQDRFVTASGRVVELRIYVEAENINRCQHAMNSLQKAMAWDEQRYGREYDLDRFNIVAVNDFNMGAMENKGLNIFNSKYILADSETATDRDYEGIEGVVAHEYFHNWTGNRITCRDWFQLSLKEGLTVFRDQSFSAELGSGVIKRIDDVRLLRLHQFAEDASPMAHPVQPDEYIEINNFYTVTIYEKGAELLRMLSVLLGPERYRQATDLYFERYDGQAVTIEDFVKCMEDASGMDLCQFRHWYRYAGTPAVQVNASYDAENKQYSLTFHQQCPDTPGQKDKPPFHIPIRIGLLTQGGTPMNLSQAAVRDELLFEFRETGQTVRFEDIEERPIPSLMRGFTAPVKLAFDYSDTDLMTLMAHDKDGFNRWDAAQSLWMRQLVGQVNEQLADRDIDPLLIDAARQVLTDSQAERSLLAEMLSLPAQTEIGERFEVIDVDAIYAVRYGLMGKLAEALKDDLLGVYMSLHGQHPGDDLSQAAIGARRLKNVALGYLMEIADQDIIELCFNQYRDADCMTDRMAALELLSHTETDFRDDAFADFEKRWGADPLVMDKWFVAQATARLPGRLAVVESLMSHQAFSIRNPNKVRSLIGAFCSANTLNFHAKDGSGYRFLARQVQQIDPMNPQLAARLIRIISRWRRYDEHRRGLLKSALEEVMSTPKLSRDVYEVVQKSLQE